MLRSILPSRLTCGGPADRDLTRITLGSPSLCYLSVTLQGGGLPFKLPNLPVVAGYVSSAIGTAVFQCGGFLIFTSVGSWRGNDEPILTLGTPFALPGRRSFRESLTTMIGLLEWRLPV